MYTVWFQVQNQLKRIYAFGVSIVAILGVCQGER